MTIRISFVLGLPVGLFLMNVLNLVSMYSHGTLYPKRLRWNTPESMQPQHSTIKRLESHPLVFSLSRIQLWNVPRYGENGLRPPDRTHPAHHDAKLRSGHGPGFLVKLQSQGHYTLFGVS